LGTVSPRNHHQGETGRLVGRVEKEDYKEAQISEEDLDLRQRQYSLSIEEVKRRRARSRPLARAVCRTLNETFGAVNVASRKFKVGFGSRSFMIIISNKAYKALRAQEKHGEPFDIDVPYLLHRFDKKC